eukprot:COSAG01_NODE_752_length_13837_cov_76.381670_23_plen_102_part_00
MRAMSSLLPIRTKRPTTHQPPQRLNVRARCAMLGGRFTDLFTDLFFISDLVLNFFTAFPNAYDGARAADGHAGQWCFGRANLGFGRLIFPHASGGGALLLF